jgi:hypothetical protein
LKTCSGSPCCTKLRECRIGSPHPGHSGGSLRSKPFLCISTRPLAVFGLSWQALQLIAMNCRSTRQSIQNGQVGSLATRLLAQLIPRLEDSSAFKLQWATCEFRFCGAGAVFVVLVCSELLTEPISTLKKSTGSYVVTHPGVQELLFDRSIIFSLIDRTASVGRRALRSSCNTGLDGRYCKNRRG